MAVALARTDFLMAMVVTFVDLQHFGWTLGEQ